QRPRSQAMTEPVGVTEQNRDQHTVGGLVTPAQALMVLVPVDSHVEIEATVSNRDIGFVEPGQEVEIKVATFNFTRYGLLHGTVLSVSSDAVGKDEVADPAKNNSQQSGRAAAPPTDDQGPVYAARISLGQTKMQIEDKLINLAPGMAVTAEIKT